jgi:SM-20-related protein
MRLPQGNLMALDYRALQQAPVQSDPYPHFVVKQVMSVEDVGAAIADYPAIDMAGIFPLDTIEGGPAFKRLIAEIQGPQLRQVIADKFGMDLSDHDTMVTIRACCRPTDGKIHTDSTFKKATLLLYLNEMPWPHPGGHLRVLKSSTDLESYAAEIPPDGGTMVAFKCTDKAWHGHHSYDGVRRYIMVNFVQDKGALKRELTRHRITAGLKKFKRMFGFGKFVKSQ